MGDDFDSDIRGYDSDSFAQSWFCIALDNENWDIFYCIICSFRSTDDFRAIDIEL